MAYGYRRKTRRKAAPRRRATAKRRTYSSPYSRRRTTRTSRRPVSRRQRPQTLRIVIEQPGITPAGTASAASLAALGEAEKPAKKAKLGSNA